MFLHLSFLQRLATRVAGEEHHVADLVSLGVKTNNLLTHTRHYNHGMDVLKHQAESEGPRLYNAETKRTIEQ